MKKFTLVLIAFLLLIPAITFGKEPGESPLSCQQCGMNRVTFAQSRMLIAYADGSTAGTCSLHCAVADTKSQGGKTVKLLQVADYNTKKLIDAKSAVWVIGGSKRGVMTSLPKWAFSKKKEAEEFVRQSGGKVTSFDEAVDMAENEQGRM